VRARVWRRPAASAKALPSAKRMVAAYSHRKEAVRCQFAAPAPVLRMLQAERATTPAIAARV